MISPTVVKNTALYLNWILSISPYNYDRKFHRYTKYVFLGVPSHDQAFKTTCVSVVRNDDATGSRWDDLSNRIREKYKKSFTKKVMHKRLPFLSWLPKYNAEDAVGDLVAGITVGLTVIPQGLAYGNLAGLPAQVCITSLVVCIKNRVYRWLLYLYLKKGTRF